MNFKTALLTAAEGGVSKNRMMKLQSAAKDGSNRLLWAALERVVKHRYRRDTGIEIKAGFDWSTIIEWLKTALPIILKLILLMFGI